MREGERPTSLNTLMCLDGGPYSHPFPPPYRAVDDRYVQSRSQCMMVEIYETLTNFYLDPGPLILEGLFVHVRMTELLKDATPDMFRMTSISPRPDQDVEKKLGESAAND